MKTLELPIKVADLTEKGVKKVKKRITSLQTDIGKNFKKMNTGITSTITGAAAIAGAGYGIVKGFEQIGSIDSAFQDLQNTTRTSAEDFDDMKASVYRLNTALGMKSPVKAANRLKIVAKQSNLTGQKLETLAYQTGLLADRFGDEEGALKAQTTIMRVFGADVKSAGDSVGYLLNQGGDLKGELLDTIHEYSSQFKDAGFNLTQTVAMVQTGLTNSWSIDKAADAFKEARIKLFSGDKTSKDAMKSMGLTGLSDQIRNEEISMTDALTQISTKLKGMKTGEQMEMGVGIFGTQWEDAGADSILSMIDSMNNTVKTDGQMELLSTQLSNKFSHKWNTAISDSTNAFSEMLMQVKPLILPLIEWFGEGAKAISSFISEYGNIAGAIGIAIGGFVAFGLVLGVVSVVGGIATAVVSGLAIAVGILTSPVVLIIAGIALLAYGIYRLEKDFNLFSGTWEVMVNRFEEGKTKIMDLKTNILEFASESKKTILDLKTNIVEFVTQSVKTLCDFGENVKTYVTAPLADIGENAVIKWVLNKAKGSTGERPKDVEESTKKHLEKAARSNLENEPAGKVENHYHIKSVHTRARSGKQIFSDLAEVAR